MTGLKYIVINDRDMEIPILFHQCVQHKDVAGRLSDSVVSAGFWNGTSAYGESVGLNLKSRPEDTDLISRAIRFSL